MTSPNLHSIMVKLLLSKPTAQVIRQTCKRLINLSFEFKTKISKKYIICIDILKCYTKVESKVLLYHSVHFLETLLKSFFTAFQ